MILIYFKKEVINKFIIIFYMKLINWTRKNYLIVILFIIAIGILIIKININIKDDKTVNFPVNTKNIEIKTESL